MIVGARKRRAEVGVRVRLNVVLYVPLGELWAFTITDRHERPVVRSIAKSATELGQSWQETREALNLLLGVELVLQRDRPLRVDEQWDVSVRLAGGRDELPFLVR